MNYLFEACIIIESGGTQFTPSIDIYGAAMENIEFG